MLDIMRCSGHDHCVKSVTPFLKTRLFRMFFNVCTTCVATAPEVMFRVEIPLQTDQLTYWSQLENSPGLRQKRMRCGEELKLFGTVFDILHIYTPLSSDC